MPGIVSSVVKGVNSYSVQFCSSSVYPLLTWFNFDCLNSLYSLFITMTSKEQTYLA